MILLKTFVYRIYSFIIMFLIAVFFTHNFDGAFSIAVSLEIVKFIQYYLFEKIWKKLFV